MVLQSELEPKQYAETLKETNSHTQENTVPPITIELSKDDNGKVKLHWTNNGIVGYKDYVALYDKDPYKAGPEGYLTRQWTWVTSHSGVYQTGTRADGQVYWMAYCGMDYASNEYRIAQTFGPWYS